MTHVYLSTACEHGKHALCRKVCKYCESRCNCTCGRCGINLLPTNMPDVLETPLDEIDMDRLAPEVSMMLMNLEKPRANLGSSGPPGRVD